MSGTPEDTYSACGFFLLRAPALPVRPGLELLRSLPATADGRRDGGQDGRQDGWEGDYADQLRKLWGAPGVRDAVRAASPHLADAVERFDDLTEKGRRKAVRGLGRYLNRMSFRSTPFGLVAGVGTGTFGQTPRTRLGASAIGAARARADSGWVMHLVKRLAFGEERPATLRVRRNDLLHVSRGRVWLSTAEGYGVDDVAAPPEPGARASGAEGAARGRRSVSVRLTGPVRAVLDHTRTPVPLGDLAALLTEAYPTAGAERIAGLLDGLFDSDILITAERPRLLVPSTGPADQDRPLTSMLPPVADPGAAGALADVEAAIQAFNRGELPVTELLATANAPLPAPLDGHPGPALQLDAKLDTAGPVVLPNAVARLAEEAAHVLLRVGTEDRYPAHLAQYAEAFSERYGHRSEVPLLEALTPETGLGPPRGYRSPGPAYPLPPGAGPAPAAGADGTGPSPREAVLTRLVTTALARRTPHVQLDDRLLDALAEASAVEDADRPPLPVLDLFLGLVPPDPGGDAGRERWRAVCSTMGVGMGGRTFARFGDLLDEDVRASLQELAVAEERRQGEDAVCAELSYLPGDARSVNVSIRPAAHTWELPVNVTPGRGEDRVTGLDDVLVGVADGKLYLRSRALGRRLHVVQRTMLNWGGAPDPCRFLLEVSHALARPVSSFSWDGLSRTMPFLPRLERGDLVLRRARWRLRPDDLALPGHDGRDGAFAEAVGAWARTWMVPRLVNIASNDNTLLLDLTSAPSLRELRDSLAQAPEDGVVLEEVLPAPDEGFLRDASGEPYAAEIVVPLVRTGRDPGRVARQITPRTAPPGGLGDPGDRSRHIGSDWLAVKLYAEPDAHDTLLGVGLAGIAGRLAERYGVPAPFFLRYRDPAPHLRVRFHAPEESTRQDVLREVTAWAYDLARGGHIADHTYVTYRREVERYGGPGLIGDVEEWFGRDSTAVVRLLRTLRESGTGLRGSVPGLDAAEERAALVALTVDRMCAALVPDAERRHALARRAAGKNAGGDLYRAAGRALWDARTGDGPVRALLDRAAAVWDPAAERLTRRMTALERDGELQGERADIVLSLLHMHCNRMGLRPTDEAAAHGVWRRLLDRAAHASR